MFLTLAVIGTLLSLLTHSQRKYKRNKSLCIAFIIMSALALLTLLNSNGKKGDWPVLLFSHDISAPVQSTAIMNMAVLEKNSNHSVESTCYMDRERQRNLSSPNMMPFFKCARGNPVRCCNVSQSPGRRWAGHFIPDA